MREIVVLFVSRSGDGPHRYVPQEQTCVAVTSFSSFWFVIKGRRSEPVLSSSAGRRGGLIERNENVKEAHQAYGEYGINGETYAYDGC